MGCHLVGGNPGRFGLFAARVRADLCLVRHDAGRRRQRRSRDRALGRSGVRAAHARGNQGHAELENVAAPDRIMFGTDWPFANARVTAEAMKTYEALDAVSSTQRSAIDRGNALRLFPKFA